VSKHHSVRWFDARQEPRCAPNPAYPDGIDLDCSGGAEVTCLVKLPYPAKRIGLYVVNCDVCNMNAACTTAGRPDDPRSIRLRCNPHKHKVQ
jgi:hypothetical protein